MSAKASTSVKLDHDLKERLEHLAEQRQRSPHWMMKQAIGEYVEREEKRQQFTDDAAEAWAEYQATGLHLTGDEVNAWLQKLVDGEDAELPECHN